MIALLISASLGSTFQNPSLLESFESAKDFSTPIPAFGSISIDGKDLSNNSYLVLQGKGGAGSPNTKKRLPMPITPKDLGVVSYYLKNDLPGVTSTFSLRFGNSNDIFTSPIMGVDYIVLDYSQPAGGSWHSYHYSENPSISNLKEITQFWIMPSNSAPFIQKIGIGNLLVNSKGTPTWIIGFDDGYATQKTIAEPYMSSKGFKGTSYLPTGWLGRNGWLNWSQVLALHGAGWAISLDGTPNDADISTYKDVDTVVKNLIAMQLDLIKHGIDDNGKYHLCYPFGNTYQMPKSIQIKNVILSEGSNKVTFEDDGGATLSAGMNFYAYGVPADTVISSVVKGNDKTITLVLSKTLSYSGSSYAMALDLSGPFALGKLPKALADAGFKTGRIASGGNFPTRFGFGTKALSTPSTGVGGLSLKQAKALIDQDVLRGDTREFFMHNITPDPDGWSEDTVSTGNPPISFFTGLIDYIYSYTSSGNGVVLTKPQLYDRDVNGASLLPH